MMSAPTVSAIRRFFRAEDYPGLKRLMSGDGSSALRRTWPKLTALEKATLFKLMAPGPALDFYRDLPYEEKYFLLCAFDPRSIAPLLEDVAPRVRTLFHRLTEDDYDEMIRELS